MIKLNYFQDYLSITRFNEIELPDFVVLTGMNGSGKSHLLEAIKENCAQIHGVQQKHIALFDYQSFRLDNEAVVNAQSISIEKEKAWKLLSNQQQLIASWRMGLKDEYSEIVKQCEVGGVGFINSADPRLSLYKQSFTKYFLDGKNRNNKNDGQLESIALVASKIPYSLDEIGEVEFKSMYKLFQFKNGFLPKQLGQIIWDYYLKSEKNNYNNFRNETRKTSEFDVLSEEEFVCMHGEKPWDMMNKILGSLGGFRYHINSPEEKDIYGPFSMKLVDSECPDLEIDFDKLSSGEKVLMALVSCIYKASSDNYFPKILLLDEIDASLHPSMIKYALNVVQNVFMAQGMKVILVTHSPTTIALAQDESLYMMHKAGLNRISKTSKQEALDLLTEGYVTLNQGLNIFDEIAGNELTIFTEGNNVTYLEKILDINGIDDVMILKGIESCSGRDQLKTLFDFFSKVTHRNKILFVWDSDVQHGRCESNNTFPFSLPKNDDNSIAEKGIENMFSESLFSEKCLVTTTRGSGHTISKFDGAAKKKFEEIIMTRNNSDDFYLFRTLVDEINRIKCVSTNIC